MMRLIMINVEKRLSFLSIIFILISIIIISSVSIYQASFNLSFFMVLNEYELLLQNYLMESIQIVEVIGVLFIILLVASELFYNINNFDSFFVSYFKKSTFIISKIFGYLIIIFIYFLIIFVSLAMVYMIRFRSVIELCFIFDIFSYYFVFFIIIYLITHIILVLFHNYFASLIIFVLYWVCKIIEKSFISKYIFLSVVIDFDKRIVEFSFDFIYLVIYFLTLLIILISLYKKTDLKVST